MALYRKKLVLVQAVQWTPGAESGWGYEDELPIDITDAMFAASRVDGVRLYPFLETPEGREYIGVGDWIITDANGEQYKCEPDEFERDYELETTEAATALQQTNERMASDLVAIEKALNGESSDALCPLAQRVRWLREQGKKVTAVRREAFRQAAEMVEAFHGHSLCTQQLRRMAEQEGQQA